MAGSTSRFTDWLRYRKETLMSDDLATLETQRSELLEEFLRLGDLRPGSITAVTRRAASLPATALNTTTRDTIHISPHPPPVRQDGDRR
jgi:hypothetical protein